MPNGAQQSYVYAGAAHWTSATDQTQHPSGLLRKAAGDHDWQTLSRGLPSGAEIRAFAIHPQNSQVIYVGTQCGPYRSTDGGEQWEDLDFPDPGVTVWTFLFHPSSSQVLYLGTAPEAIYRSDNGGDRWKRLRLCDSAGAVNMGFSRRVIRLTADPGSPDEIYAALEVGGVIRSSDGGESWSDCSQDLLRLAKNEQLKSRIGSDTEVEGMMDSHAIAVSAAQSGAVFLATRMGLFHSSDRGNTWADMEIGRFSPLTYARDVQVAPDDPKVLYTCLSRAARSDMGSLYRSQDLGQTWHRFDHDVTPRSTMMAVAASPQNPEQVYCATRGGQVFGTHDGGTTWGEYPLPAGLQDVYALACS
ncbi:Ycf48-like protein [Candidatus Entotheonellaceae bacterium PAL068K]